MSDEAFLEQGIELRQISRNDASAHSLMQADSEENPKRRSGREEEKHGNFAVQRKTHKFSFRDRGARFEGWKLTTFLAFIASLIVLFFNVGFLLYTTTHHGQMEHKNTILYEGNCDKVQNLSIAFHLLINFLSTILLSASNFGMQCLAAPTRWSIDEAHKSGRWLDIGVPSVRNLSRVSNKRSFLWLCLGVSSLPLHLMYNSAIYPITAASAYDVFAGPASLAQIEFPELRVHHDGAYSQGYSSMNATFRELYYAAKTGTLDHLDNLDCLDAFAQIFQTTYRMLWIVSDSYQENNTYVLVYTNPVFNPSGYNGHGIPGPYDWICPDTVNCNSDALPLVRSKISQKEWTAGNPENLERYNVQYCMAMKKPQYCRLQYSLLPTIVVVVFNLVKASVLLYIWLEISEIPILTIGDAIASFLRRPDPFTQTGCLLSGTDVRHIDRVHPTSIKKKLLHRSKRFENERERWGSAASARRWAFSVFFWLLAIIVCVGLLAFGLKEISINGSNLDAWTTQLGATNANTLINSDSWPNSVLANVIIANLPQLIFSFIYFAFNSLLTSMCLAAEWSSYANHRKSLRVSYNPQLSQRSNYFLSIPYRYALPLMVVSMTLQWLISESLFTVGIEAWDMNMVRDPESDLTTCGYSPVAILSSICIGGFMFICLVALSFRPLESGMPVAGSCSLAIAAACHPEVDPNRDAENEGGDISWNGDEDMGFFPVQWGAVPVDGPIGHCSFTSGRVEMPQKGREYQ